MLRLLLSFWVPIIRLCLSWIQTRDLRITDTLLYCFPIVLLISWPFLTNFQHFQKYKNHTKSKSILQTVTKTFLKNVKTILNLRSPTKAKVFDNRSTYLTICKGQLFDCFKKGSNKIEFIFGTIFSILNSDHVGNKMWKQVEIKNTQLLLY